MPPKRYAEIVLPLPLDQTFTYEVPEAMRDRAIMGMRAVVPFKTRQETGYIVSFSDETEVEKVRAIRELPDEEPAFAQEMLELCRWLSEYYCCSWGEALQCAIPAGTATRQQTRYALIPEGVSPGRFTDRQRAIVGELHRRGPLTEGQLIRAIGQGALSSTLQSLVQRGLLLAESIVSDPGTNIATEPIVMLLEDNLLEADGLMRLQRRSPKQAAVYLDLLHGSPERPAAMLYEKHAANAGTLQGLEQKGLIRREEREIYRTPDFTADEKSVEKHTLNVDQQAAYEAIVKALDSAEYGTYLLQGITGSGKTEVYLQAIEHVLEQGRSAIILVPEISLTPQTVGRFLGRFDTRIAVLHSGLSRGERYDEWRRAQRGEVRIVVGARSAIFAPLPNLGIIVVDEEHDTSYKQGETPRYHARDVAIMRSILNKAVCVLGSATPSIESFHNSVRGKSTRLELLRRATNARLPEVQLIDMREEAKEAKGEVILSRRLEQEVNNRVKKGEQVILLLNRRGFSPYVLCPQCGWIAECEDCNVSMTYHERGAFLSCHYCAARRPVPPQCGECDFKPLVFLGTGTQKVEDFLMRSFPGSRVGRMDADTTSGRGGHARILGRFAEGEIDILIGTQMIAKGHDYPGVTLVGVINADRMITSGMRTRRLGV